MENNDNIILSDQTVGKEYQIPELVDLNGIGEAMGIDSPCGSGSTPAGLCSTGTGVTS